MNENTAATDNHSYTVLPHVGKRVLRMGIAGNYGLRSPDILWAADQGANYWVCGAGFGKVGEGIREVIGRDRESHVLAMLGWGYWGWQIRRSVEKALRNYNTDYIDVFKLGWLGRTSAYTRGTVDTLLELKREGKIRVIGTSIHNRQRAGQLALDSEIELLMIRYNAKHPGAETDIFPHLRARNPAIVSYTALAWRQLTRPLKDVQMPPWPGSNGGNPPPLTAEQCYRFVLSNPHVHVVLTGPRSRKELAQNLESLHRGPLPEDQLEWVREYGRLVKSRKRMDFI